VIVDHHHLVTQDASSGAHTFACRVLVVNRHPRDLQRVPTVSATLSEASRGSGNGVDAIRVGVPDRHGNRCLSIQPYLIADTTTMICHESQRRLWSAL
jgi:hypothetical protein